MSYNERLIKALEQKGISLSLVDIEREFNLRWLGEPITPHAVGKWLRGESIPSREKQLVLSQWLEVDLTTQDFDLGQTEIAYLYRYASDNGKSLISKLQGGGR